MQKHLLALSNIVNMISKKFYINSNITQEDLRQELWLKLLIMDKTHSWFKELDPISQRRHAITALKRKTIDIIRHQARRYDTGDTCLRKESSAAALTIIEQHQQFKNMSDLFGYDSKQDQICVYKELQNIILSWAVKQSPDVRELAQEFINPSVQTQKEWEKIKQTGHYKRPKFGDREAIPPSSLCKILGFKPKVWYKFSTGLQTYLRGMDYPTICH